MNIGDNIKALRKARRMTQERLAEALDVTPQAVSKWENGLSSPDIDALPRLATLFDTSIDALLGYDRRRIDEAVEALVAESVPLRREPAQAEAFYREALKRYPDNEVLLNCLLMVIPSERRQEKLEIGLRLLDCTTDDAIRFDVLRLLALTCRDAGDTAMAEHCLAQIPEVFFLQTEVAATVRTGEAQLNEIRKTEDVCLRILATMLALRIRRADDPAARERLRAFAGKLFDLYRGFDDQREHVDRLERMLDDGELAE